MTILTSAFAGLETVHFIGLSDLKESIVPLLPEIISIPESTVAATLLHATMLRNKAAIIMYCLTEQYFLICIFIHFFEEKVVISNEETIVSGSVSITATPSCG